MELIDANIYIRKIVCLLNKEYVSFPNGYLNIFSNKISIMP